MPEASPDNAALINQILTYLAAHPQIKYMYKDHDTAAADQNPPVQNTWYTVLNTDDVRLLICALYHQNTEVGVKTVEVRWTVDGNVYFYSGSLNSGQGYYVFRNEDASGGGAHGLSVDPNYKNGAYYADKCGHSFKVEVRMTSAPGTAERLLGRCVYETLEPT